MQKMARVINPWYDHEGRKYMDLEFDGEFHTVKIPFRYGRVMCKVVGIRPVQEIGRDENVKVLVEKKTWNEKTYYVLISIKPRDA